MEWQEEFFHWPVGRSHYVALSLKTEKNSFSNPHFFFLSFRAL